MTSREMIERAAAEMYHYWQNWPVCKDSKPWDEVVEKRPPQAAFFRSLAGRALDAALPHGEDVGGVVKRLRAIAQAYHEINKQAGHKGKQWSLEAEPCWIAADLIEAQAAQIARYEARLEIDHHYVVGDGEELVRKEIPSGEREAQIDGVACRDATIAELEAQIASLSAKVAEVDDLSPQLNGAHKDLLPCPFCGGEAERIDVPDEDDIDGGVNAGGSCIQCSHCTASTALHFDRKENLISSWNRRVAFRRDSLAKHLAALDGVILQEVRSTVGPADDANNWREYLGRADDLLSMISAEISS